MSLHLTRVLFQVCWALAEDDPSSALSQSRITCDGKQCYTGTLVVLSFRTKLTIATSIRNLSNSHHCLDTIRQTWPCALFAIAHCQVAVYIAGLLLIRSSTIPSTSSTPYMELFNACSPHRQEYHQQCRTTIPIYRSTFAFKVQAVSERLVNMAYDEANR
jgi:hypothetical protein